MKLQCRRHDGAYTLPELLLTVTLVAMLLVLSFAGMQKITAHRDRSQCLSNLRQLGVASLLYAADHQQVLPVPTHWSSPVLSDWYWWERLSPYLYANVPNRPVMHVNELFRCPCGEGGKKLPRGFTLGIYPMIDYAQFIYYPAGQPFSLRNVNPEKAAYLIDGENYSGHLGISNHIQLASIVNQRALDRHLGKVHVLFCSGRIELIGPERLVWTQLSTLYR